jgi:hypothetical protein
MVATALSKLDLVANSNSHSVILSSIFRHSASIPIVCKNIAYAMSLGCKHTKHIGIIIAIILFWPLNNRKLELRNECLF